MGHGASWDSATREPVYASQHPARSQLPAWLMVTLSHITDIARFIVV